MRVRRSILALAGVVLGILVAGVSQAFALRLHEYGSSFGGEGAAAGQFQAPMGVAVSEVGGSAGDVYISDTGNNRVQIFDSTGTTALGEFNGASAPTGTFQNPEWVAVDNSTNPLDPSAGDVYVIDVGHNVVDKFSPTGAYEGQITTGAEGTPLSELLGVAVDPEGRVWVYQAGGEVDDYSDALNNGFLASRKTVRNFQFPGFAVDSEDHLYVGRYFTYSKFDEDGKELIEEMARFEAESTGVGVDSYTDYVYVDEGKGISAFDRVSSCTASAKCKAAPASSLVEQFGSAQLTGRGSVAVDANNGTVYVTDRTADAVRVFPAIFIPEPITGSASNVDNEGSATLNGTVNPEGVPLTSCRFEYGTTTSYGENISCEQSPIEIGSGTSPVPVSADLTGLTPSSRYHYRLVVANVNGEKYGSDGSFVLLAPPTVRSESVPGVGTGIATVGATIGSGGVPTSYHVEYGTNESYGSSTPEVELGAALDAGAVQVQLTGLQPGTAYHFRFVAHSALGTALGADRTFTTARSAESSLSTLPDGRAYELVSSPTENQDAYYPLTGVTINEVEKDFQTVLPFKVAGDGNAVTYPAEPSAEAGNGDVGSDSGNQYIARREPTGWASSDIAPPTGPTTQYEYFTSDLSVAMFRSVNADKIVNAVPPAPAGCPGIYSGTGGDSGYHSLYETTPLPPGECPGTFSAGATEDGSHLLFEAGGILTEEAQFSKPSGAGNLYDTSNDHVYQVNVLPDGQPEATPTATFGAPRLQAGSREQNLHEFYPNLYGFVSSDGSRIFWSSTEAPEIEAPIAPKALYVRENDTRPQSPIGPHGECSVPEDACTVQIDAGEPSCVAEGKCESGGGAFWGASSDGSRVFFTDCRKLTADSTSVAAPNCVDEGAEEGGLTGSDLYEYQLETGKLVDLTVDHGAGDRLGADVKGVVGVSRDGSYVYFVAAGALASGATPRICGRASVRTEEETKEAREEEAGQLPAHHGCNLYVWHDGEIALIASLLFQDNELEAIVGNGVAPRGDWRESLGERTAHVTPDGHALAFVSTRSLTGYRSEGLREVFVYDATSRTLECASCDRSGVPPSGNPERLHTELGGYLPTSNEMTFMEHLISDDGDRVFFETDRALVPQDTNGVQDVYEWERNGSGSCLSVAAGTPQSGCVYLISSGEASSQTYLVDADLSGENVFFMARDKLTQQARNENIVVYDARVNGGFLTPSLACTGTGCQGVPPAPPIFATPSSATFTGVGNFSAPTSSVVKSKTKTTRCKRGYVKRKGRCVRKKRKGEVGKKLKARGAGRGTKQ